MAGTYSQRHHAAFRTIDELDALAGAERLDAQNDVTVLTAPNGLPHELGLVLSLAADSLLVNNMGSTCIHRPDG